MGWVAVGGPPALAADAAVLPRGQILFQAGFAVR